MYTLLHPPLLHRPSPAFRTLPERTFVYSTDEQWNPANHDSHTKSQSKKRFQSGEVCLVLRCQREFWTASFHPSSSPSSHPKSTPDCDLQLLHGVHATMTLPFETQIGWGHWLCAVSERRNLSAESNPQFSVWRIAKATDIAASPLFSIYGTSNMTLSILHNQTLYAWLAPL